MDNGIQAFAVNDSDEKILLDAENTPQGSESTPAETAPEPAPVEAASAPADQTQEQITPVAQATPAEDPNEIIKKLQGNVENLNKALYEQRFKMREFKNYVEQVRNGLTAQKQQEVKPPDYNTDPLEHLKTRDDIAAETIKRLEEEQYRIKEQIESTNVLTTIANMENAFRRNVPDYDPAFNFLIDFRKKELALVGITDEEAQISEIRNNSAAISRAALAQGKNPAEVVYNLAKAYGYKGAQPAPAPAQKVEDTKAHLAVVQAAQQKAGKTLSNAGATDTAANYDSLLNAKGAEFEKGWKEIFGEY